jgi:hypothetical protein
MPDEYIEIVHKSPENLALCRDLGHIHKRIVDKIFNLEKTVGVHYYHGSLDDNFPDVPKDTPIRLGGGMWEWCVQSRARYLRENGYQRVIPDKSISVSFEDSFADAGLINQQPYSRL